jgi:hypothetical protein
MTIVRISLDPTSPIHRELEKEISEYVKSLESVEFTTVEIPSEAGKLSGIDSQTLSMVVNLSAATINFIAAVMTISAQVHANTQQTPKQEDRKRKFKDVVIDVEGVKISLPVTDETARKYLRKISIKIGEISSPQTTHKNRRITVKNKVKKSSYGTQAK